MDKSSCLECKKPVNMLQSTMTSELSSAYVMTNGHVMLQCTEASYNQTAMLCLSAQQAEDADSHSGCDRFTDSH